MLMKRMFDPHGLIFALQHLVERRRSESTCNEKISRRRLHSNCKALVFQNSPNVPEIDETLAPEALRAADRTWKPKRRGAKIGRETPIFRSSIQFCRLL
jgi:hypothetical protein